jgi:hypothetical protein
VALEWPTLQLHLGQGHSGNKFTVVLRNFLNPPPTRAAIAAAVATVKRRGFVNFFGFQRVGEPLLRGAGRWGSDEAAAAAAAAAALAAVAAVAPKPPAAEANAATPWEGAPAWKVNRSFILVAFTGQTPLFVCFPQNHPKRTSLSLSLSLSLFSLSLSLCARG